MSCFVDYSVSDRMLSVQELPFQLFLPELGYYLLADSFSGFLGLRRETLLSELLLHASSRPGIFPW